MSKKLFTLVSGILGGVSAIACACVAYFVKDAGLSAKIIAAIGIGVTAINEIMLQFVDKAVVSKSTKRS